MFFSSRGIGYTTIIARYSADFNQDDGFMRHAWNTLAGVLMLLSAVTAFAQNFPSKPVRIVVPFPPGGGADTLARIMEPKLAGIWAQPIVVENRPGASGHIGADFVAKSVPDGHTLLMSSTASLTERNVNQFAPVSLVSASAYIVTANPGVAAANIRELIALAKANPGKLSFGSSGTGAASHLSAELFKAMAGVDLALYDLVAKADGDVGRMEQIRPLIQKLLADRFQLTIHRDSKELPIYALVVGKSGSKLKESEANGPGPQIRMGRGLVNGQGMGMDMLANQLSNAIGRTVLDKTGLTGKYDIKLEFTPEDGPGHGPGDGPETAPPPENATPSIFTALQEQLGLKLEPQDSLGEVLVIDHVEQPIRN